MSKKLEGINQNRKFFETYFKDDLEAIEEELKKSIHYSGIIDKEIEKLSETVLGANRGSQHYLIEHITNAVQLQTQRQGLRKDRFNIKKTIMDYSSKFIDNTESSSADVLEEIRKIAESDKNNTKEKISNTSIDLDNEIDDILNSVEN